MARRAVSFRGPALRQGQRRKSTWIQISLGPTTIASSGSVLIGSLNAAALAFRPFTVVRTRIYMHIESDQSAASEQVRGAFGAIVVSDQAVAAGVASIPVPVTHSDAPFFVYEPFVNSFLFGDGTGFITPVGTNIIIDSKAMRKVDVNEDIALQAQNAVAFGSLLSIQGRMLVKLH